MTPSVIPCHGCSHEATSAASAATMRGRTAMGRLRAGREPRRPFGVTALSRLGSRARSVASSATGTRARPIALAV